MQGSIDQKSRVLELLMAKSVQLLEKVRGGLIDDTDREFFQRENLILQLEACDRDLKGTATPKDEEWVRQLQFVQKMNEEIAKELELQMKALQRLESHHDRLISLLDQSGAGEWRGQNVTVRG